MKKKIAILLTCVLCIGSLTGCRPDVDKNANTPTSADKVTVPTESPDKAVETVPGGSDNANMTPAAEPTVEPTVEPTAEPTAEPTEEPVAVPTSDPASVSVKTNSSITDAERNSDLWKNTSDIFMSFINGEKNAEGMEMLCNYFSEEDTYSLKDIAGIYETYIYEEMGCMDISLTEICYSFIKSATENKPNLVVNLVYDSEYDSAHDEELVFCEKEGSVRFITNVDTYYRSEGMLNDCGYYWYSGSSGVNIYSMAFHYIDSNNEDRFVYSVEGVFGCSEPKISNIFLPDDADSLILNEEENEYSDLGNTMEMFHFEQYNEAKYPKYSDYERSAYYTFYDFDGNPIMPDDEYLEKCKNEGINVVSEAEIKKLIDERHAELGISEAVANAPLIKEFTELNVEDFIDEDSKGSTEPVEFDPETIEGYMSFLNGDIKASSLGLLCNKFTENGQYKLKKIVNSYEEFLEERDSVELDFTDLSYAFAENEIEGKPCLVLRITYESPDRMDAPHIENMIFDFDGYCCDFIANYETCYRTYANIGTKGVMVVTGSNSAFEYTSDYYYIDNYMDNYNCQRFLYSFDSVYGLTKAEIPAIALPTDTTLEEGNQEGDYDFLELLRVSFRDISDSSDEAWYNKLLRECCYIFYDEEGNEVIPDEEYISKCAEDGINIVSEEELAKRMNAIYEEYGVTEENLFAPCLEDSDFTHFDF